MKNRQAVFLGLVKCDGGWSKTETCLQVEGSPQSLIYPYIGKLTSFLINQFFRFGKEHQTLMRPLDLQTGLGFASSLVALRRLLPQNFDSPTRRVGMLRDDEQLISCVPMLKDDASRRFGTSF